MHPDRKMVVVEVDGSLPLLLLIMMPVGAMLVIRCRW